MQEVPLGLCQFDTNAMAKFYSILLVFQLLLYSLLLFLDYTECRVRSPTVSQSYSATATVSQGALLDTHQVDTTHPYLDNMAQVRLPDSVDSEPTSADCAAVMEPTRNDIQSPRPIQRPLN